MAFDRLASPKATFCTSQMGSSWSFCAIQNPVDCSAQYKYVLTTLAKKSTVRETSEVVDMMEK